MKKRPAKTGLFFIGIRKVYDRIGSGIINEYPFRHGHDGAPVMKKISKELATALIIVICVAVVYTTKSLVFRTNEHGPVETIGKIKGSDDAPIKVTEFIDFQCPACAHGAAYLKEMVEKYPEAIRVELKHYPLQMHRHGYLSSRYAECAASQGRFWPFQDILLARQDSWQRLIDARPVFERIADESRLDRKKLKACLKDDRVDEIINKNKEEGRALGIRSTPTYFVNGEMFVGKKSLEEQVSKLLEEHGY